MTVENLVTHTYWVNKLAGKHFDDVDVQCANPIRGKKWCPKYIFDSDDPKVALTNWKAFKDLVKTYLNELKLSPGDLVSIVEDAIYYSGKQIPTWVKQQNWYVKKVEGDRVVIDENEKRTNAICSPANIKYLTVVRGSEKDGVCELDKPGNSCRCTCNGCCCNTDDEEP